MKKVIASLIIVALFLSLLGNKERKEPSNVCLSCASWEKQFNSRDELYQASDLVIKGKVLSQEPELRCDLVFSRSYVKVECVYKTSSKNVINDAVEIVQTGGTLNDYTTVPIHGAPLLESGNEYLLFLQLSQKLFIIFSLCNCKHLPIVKGLLLGEFTLILLISNCKVS